MPRDFITGTMAFHTSFSWSNNHLSDIPAIPGRLWPSFMQPDVIQNGARKCCSTWLKYIWIQVQYLTLSILIVSVNPVQFLTISLSLSCISSLIFNIQILVAYFFWQTMKVYSQRTPISTPKNTRNPYNQQQNCSRLFIPQKLLLSKNSIQELPATSRSLKHVVLESYIKMASKQKQDVDDALQTLIQIVNQVDILL